MVCRRLRAYAGQGSQRLIAAMHNLPIAEIELSRMRSGVEVKDSILPDEIEPIESKLREYLQYYELQMELMKFNQQLVEVNSPAYQDKLLEFFKKNPT